MPLPLVSTWINTRYLGSLELIEYFISVCTKVSKIQLLRSDLCVSDLNNRIFETFVHTLIAP